MSEQSQPNEPSVAGGPAIPDENAELDYVEIDGERFPPAAPSVEEPAAEPAATEPEPAAVAEPEPAPATPPPADEPYRFTTLANGQIELSLASGERYLGKDYQEVAQKAAAGRVEANKVIRELKERPAAAAAPTTPVPPALAAAPALDPATTALMDLMAPGLGFASGKDMAAAFAALQQSTQATTQTLAEVRAEAQANAQMTTFLQSNQDFVATDYNAKVLDGIMDDAGLPFNAKNLRLAHAEALRAGLYAKVDGAATTSAVTVTAPVRLANGQFATAAVATPPAPPRNTMPPPPSGASPATTTGKPAPTVSELWSMPEDELFRLVEAETRQRA